MTSKTILLVEDDIDLRSFLEIYLKDLDFTVLTADNGIDGLDLLKKRGDVDAIFTDIFMPYMSGIELYHQVKVENPDLPCVFVTGQNSESLVEEIQNLEVVETLEKPLDIFQVRNLLSRLFDGS